jgi:threonine synthase
VRAAAEVQATSSPSMDISKASNFERYIYDLLERDGGGVRALWQSLDAQGVIDLSGSPFFRNVPETGFVSGRSTHADRIATIREIHARFGVTLDPHTADGLKVGLALREPGVPLLCLETALPAKFAATIREALGQAPARPAQFQGLEDRPQR